MAAVTGNRGAVVTHQGNANNGEEHRHTHQNNTIHFLHSSV
jgi:hypothetical protein